MIGDNRARGGEEKLRGFVGGEAGEEVRTHKK